MITNGFRLPVGLSLVFGLIWTSAVLGQGPPFDPAMHYAAGNMPWSVAIGDLDGDQAPDLAVANSGSANVSVLLNQLGWVGDLDGDGEIGLGDLAILLAAYDSCDGDPYWDPVADLDDSGCVDLADLAALLAVYDTTCP